MLHKRGTNQHHNVRDHERSTYVYNGEENSQIQTGRKLGCRISNNIGKWSKTMDRAVTKDRASGDMSANNVDKTDLVLVMVCSICHQHDKPLPPTMWTNWPSTGHGLQHLSSTWQTAAANNVDKTDLVLVMVCSICHQHDKPLPPTMWTKLT